MIRFQTRSFFLFCIVFLISIAGLAGDYTPEKTLKILTKRHLSEDEQRIKQQIMEQINSEPSYRADIIDLLAKRLNSYQQDYKGDGEIRALRELSAVEKLPQLLERWNKTGKKTYHLDWADARIQLLITIVQFMPEQQRIKFLIETERDQQEAPKVRFRATILLCADGNKEAVKHVLSVYEQMKKQYPGTTRIAPEEQKQYPPRQEKWDMDADMMTDYTENGLLLDASNKDTDGDGLLDGNDRNPLSAGREQLSEAQQIAHFLFYLHARYRSYSNSPFPFKVWIVQTIDNYDGRGLTSLFNGMELTGFDGVALHLGREQIEEYRCLHGYGTPIINVHEMGSTDETEKKFSFSEYIAPAGATGCEITLRCFDGIWLPISWELKAIA